jgi:hypothetical protein
LGHYIQIDKLYFSPGDIADSNTKLNNKVQQNGDEKGGFGGGGSFSDALSTTFHSGSNNGYEAGL